MKATHIAVIKTMSQDIKFDVVVVELKGNTVVVQQVNKGSLYGPTFIADSVTLIPSPLDDFIADVKAAMKELQFNEFINGEEHNTIVDMYYEFKEVHEVVTCIARKRSK